MSAGVAVAASPPRVASGTDGGAYATLAEGLSRRLGGRLVPSEGSVQSLELLVGGGVDFALIQQDVLTHVLERDAGAPRERVRVVDRVFFDYLHLLVRRPLHLSTVRELRGLRVWRGPSGSGTRYTANRFLDIIGIAPQAYLDAAPELQGLDLAGLSTALRGGAEAAGLDVAMVVAAPGSDGICRLTSAGLVEILPVDHPTRRRMTAESEAQGASSQLVFASIPGDTYARQPAPVPTLAVPVLLVTSLGPEAGPLVARAREAVHEEWRAMRDASRRRSRSERRTAGVTPAGPHAVCPLPAVEPMAAALVDANLPLYWNDEPSTRLWARWIAFERAWRPVGVLLLVVASAWWLSASPWGARVRRHAVDRPLVFAFVVALVSVLLITLSTYWAERELNENFQSIPESFWSITVYLFSGLEDRTPYTGLGKGLAALGLLLGPALFALLTGHSAKYFISRERTMPRHLTDHVLLLNWNERALQLAEELHSPVVTSGQGHAVIVALTDQAETVERLKKESKERDFAVLEDFYLSVGDPTEERALRSANAQDANTILVLADDRVGERADERTIRSVFMLRRIARAEKRDLHVVVEIVDPANEVVIDEIAEDFPGLLERISGLRVRTCLLAQAALSPGIVEFYSDLLRVSADSNEVYTRPIPDSAVGATFTDYAGHVLRTVIDPPLIPVGIQRFSTRGGRPRIHCNPRPGTPGATLQSGDRLVFLAYDSPTGPLPELS